MYTHISLCMHATQCKINHVIIDGFWFCNKGWAENRYIRSVILNAFMCCHSFVGTRNVGISLIQQPCR